MSDRPASSWRTRCCAVAGLSTSCEVNQGRLPMPYWAHRLIPLGPVLHAYLPATRPPSEILAGTDLRKRLQGDGVYHVMLGIARL